jgi:hypothetical protein
MLGKRSIDRVRALTATAAVTVVAPLLVALPGHAGNEADVSVTSGLALDGDVWLTSAQLQAVRDRVDRGEEPAASAAALLFDEVEGDLTREPDPPEEWFVPAFYQDPDGHRAAKDGLMADANAAYRLALAYYLTDDPDYAIKAVDFIAAWSTEVETFRTTEDSRLSFSYHIPSMIAAASLLRGTEVWSDDVDADFDAFLDHTVPLLNTMSGLNNWGNWGMVFVMSAAAYQADEAAFTGAVSRWQELLADQIDEDGHLHREVTRNGGLGTHGIWYSHFTLQPQLLAAEIAAVNGVDLYGYQASNGRTLEMAVGPVAGWVADPESFPYLDESLTVDDLSSVREIAYLVEQGTPASSISYFELTQGRWDDPNAATVLADDRPVSSVHSVPHLTLTHGGVTCGDSELVCGEIGAALRAALAELGQLLATVDDLHGSEELADDQAAFLVARASGLSAAIESAADHHDAGDGAAMLGDVDSALATAAQVSDWVENQERAGELAAETASLLRDSVTTVRAHLDRVSQVASGVSGILTPESDTLTPGETVLVALELRNDGPRTLRNVAVSLAPPGEWTVSPNRPIRVARLVPGDVFTGQFEVTVADSESGGRAIGLGGNVTYRVGQGAHELPLHATVDVGLPVELTASSSFNPIANPVTHLIDGDLTTWWASAENVPPPHWVELSLATDVGVAEVVVYTRRLEPELIIHDLEVATASGDADLAVQARVEDNEELDIALKFDDVVEADRIRVTVERETYGGQPRGFADLAQIEVYGADGQRLELIEKPAEPSEPAQYETDFSGYPAGSAPSDWTTWWRESDWTVLDDPSRLQHTIGTAGRRALTWDEPGNVVGDVEIFGVVRGRSANTLFTLPIYVSGTAGAENGYYVDTRQPDGLVRINRYLDGNLTTLGSASFDWESDVWYRVLLRREGDTLRAKIWADGDTEPDWMLTATDETFHEGPVGVGGFQGGSVNDWAFVGVGTGGESAPRGPDDELPPIDVPVENPIPEVPIESGVSLVLEEVATVPAFQDTAPMARINHLSEVPDGSGRLAVPDLFGSLYLIAEGVPSEYLDLAAEFDDFVNSPGLGAGFGSVSFHPEFAENGLFYTVHTEAGAALDEQTPDLPGPETPAVHGVITEWMADDPSADSFVGSHREVVRIGYATALHGLQEINFNPIASPDDDDYGLLYIGSGDGERVPNWTDGPQDPGKPQGKILRIDPRGSDSTNGEYGVPASNPFVDEVGSLGEIFALGLRNPHRFSWDPDDGRMFLGHIGEQVIDSIYEVRAGDNFGWNEREGSYRFDRSDPANVYPLPDDDETYGFTYPVVELDNPRDARSVVGGFVYRGDKVPELEGRYVFGDVLSGAIRFTNAAEMVRGSDRAQPYDLGLVDTDGRPFDLPAGSRGPDMRLGQDASGELYVLSKATGEIWKVVGAQVAATCEFGDTVVTDVMAEESWAPLNSAKWQFPGDEVILAEPGEPADGPRRPFEYAILTEGAEWGSFALDAEVRVDVPEPVGRDVVIVLGYQSDTEFYYVHLSEDDANAIHNGIFVVDNADRVRIDDQWNGVSSARPAIAPGMEWHRVNVRHCADSGEIAVFVDGDVVPLMTATDTTFTSGRVGFGSFDDIGRIRDLTVTGTAQGG